MDFSYKFKNLKSNEELIQYVEEKAQRLKKFELKPITTKVTFSAERYKHSVAFYLRGPHFELRASAFGDDFFTAIDKCFLKMERQLARRKAKVQNHKCIEKSNYGDLSRLNPELEIAHPPTRRTG